MTQTEGKIMKTTTQKTIYLPLGQCEILAAALRSGRNVELKIGDSIYTVRLDGMRAIAAPDQSRTRRGDDAVFDDGRLV
jgi:hypothetical protein